MVKWRLILIQTALILTLLPVTGKGQYYQTGNSPAGIHWRQITNKEFKLIFPREDSLRAIRMAQFLDSAILPGSSSIHHNTRQFPLILHSYNSISNGSSIVAPRRIELFPRSPFNSLPEEYGDHLLVHEYRHMVQMDKMNQGVTKWAGFLLGEQASAAVIGLHVPYWLMEGDAVLSETLLSRSGRGRSARFIQPLRTVVMETGGYSYDKALFGSYRDYVPNHYILGYHMTSMGRMLGGATLWDRALDHVARYPFTISSLSRFMKKETGFNRQSLYGETLRYFGQYWNNECSEDSLLTIAPIIPAENSYVEFLKPYPVSETEWICLKRELGAIPEFIRINDKGEYARICIPGSIDWASFSYANGRLIWAELRPDIRWEHRSYSDIIVYDIKSRKFHHVTRKSRLFYPVLNSDASQFAAIHEDSKGISSLSIRDLQSGQEKIGVTTRPYEHLSKPIWTDDDSAIFVLGTGREGTRILRFDISSGDFSEVYKAGFIEIGSLAFQNQRLYFTAPAGAVDGLYYLNIDTHSIFYVGKTKFGIDCLTAQGDQICFSDYGQWGFSASRIEVKADPGQRIAHLSPLFEPVTPMLARTPGEVPVTPDTTKKFSTKPYHKFGHLFQIHSWAPLYIDPVNYGFAPGLVVMSQNDLSTLSGWAGYRYTMGQDQHDLIANLRYTGWYPKFGISYSGGPRPDPSKDNDNRNQNRKYWSHLTMADMTLPWNFSSGRWSRRLQLSLYSAFRVNTGLSGPVNSNLKLFAGGGINYFVVSNMSYRDLYPMWGYSASIRIDLSNDLKNLNAGAQMSVKTYLPGIGHNHSLRLSWYGYRYLSIDDMPETNWVLPRGIVDSDKYYPDNFKLDYSLPLAYPDLNMAGVIYLKRLKANLFFDLAVDKNWSGIIHTEGVDITADFNPFRMGFEVDGGVRTIFLPQEKRLRFELLLNFSIN